MRRKEWMARIQYYPLEEWGIPITVPIPVPSKWHLRINFPNPSPPEVDMHKLQWMAQRVACGYDGYM
jgi:hypothetical protein